MKYIFFGTPEFAAIVLERLIATDLLPIALVANPDRPVGRKKILTSPPTKVLIAHSKSHITVLQPEKISEIAEELKDLKPDLFVVAAYAKIIPQGILDIPRLGTIGVHPSLLPRLRGASPIQTAILTGEPRTGVSLYEMTAGMDAGPILQQETLVDYDTERETTNILLPHLAELAGNMLVRSLEKFAEGKLHGTPQDGAVATFTKKFGGEDGFVKSDDLAAAEAGNEALALRIDRMIRALNPEPGVWTQKNDKRMKLLAARLDGAKLILTRIQYEGKMPQEIGSSNTVVIR